MRFVCRLLILLSISAALIAQEARSRPSYRAVRATAAPVIDADLSDPAWQTAPEITGFTQVDPEEGKPAKNDTIVKVAYDENAIYFGAFMKDDGKVTPLLARRDNDLNNGDYIRISIDSQQDRLSGAGFVVNASNVQMDMTLYNDIYNDNSWDAVWQSAAKIVDGGWVAEVRIPYSQLRFPDKPVHTWGFNISRWSPRTMESTRLVYTPKSESGFVSRFADLTGIEGIHPKRAFEIMPYAVARTDLFSRADNPFISASEHRMDGGLDVKYSLTSSLRLTGTINPDFGQVEVDPAVVNLSQFETFFPEKRPFFTEGAQTFNFGNGPANSRWGFNMSFPTFFYSRRIGRSPQGVVGNAEYQDAPGESTILGAAKLTGKVGNGWTVGILDALTDREQAMFRRGTEVGKMTVEPMTNYLVGRAMKEYGKDSRAGFMFTATNRRLSENLEPTLRENAYFAGVDGYTLLKDKSWIIEWMGAGSLVQGSEAAIAATQRSGARYYDRPDAEHVEFDPTRTSLSGFMGRAMVSKQKGRWRPNVQVQALSPGFEINDVGFLPRVDAISTHAVLQYLNTDLAQTSKRFREISTWTGKWQNFNFDGDLIGNGVNSSFYGQFQNYWWMGAWAGGQAPTLDDQRTRGGPLARRPSSYHFGGELGSDSRKKVSFNTWGERVSAGDGAVSYYGGAGFTYRPIPSLRLSLNPRLSDTQSHSQYVTRHRGANYEPTYGDKYVFASLDQTQFELGVRAEWTMNARLSMQLYLQPFIASGEYYDFKHLTRARDDDYTPMAESAVGFNPDFNLRSVRGSAVVRWEFRPGSALYVVWNENRSEVAPIGDFQLRRDFSALPDAPSQDVFLVKFSYWLPI